MMTHLRSAATLGMTTCSVDVEVVCSRGLPQFTIVGLPDTAVQESKERVRSALVHSDIPFPEGHITVNLAPGDLKKVGPIYDLPIAVGLASQAFGFSVFPHQAFVGELSLNGQLRSVSGILGMLIDFRSRGTKEFFIPAANQAEAALVSGITVYAAENLSQVIAYLRGEKQLMPVSQQPFPVEEVSTENPWDLIQGQAHAKRGCEIAAAGHHHLLFYGPPGSGKTLLAKSLATLLPSLSEEEMMEVTRIYSLIGKGPERGVISSRPFRSPHHSISPVALIGGGSPIQPGEVTLSHQGILFLDELLEFPSSVLNQLRAPIEDRVVTISRAQYRVTFPTNCMVVGAMNPCPCGYYQDPERACTCRSQQIIQYQKRLSGPLLDRFDLTVSVPRIAVDILTEPIPTESLRDVRERVRSARDRQWGRFKTTQKTNSQMTVREIAHLAISPSAKVLLDSATRSLHLSPRAAHKVVKVALTISDLRGGVEISENDLAESLQFRMFDGP